MSDLDNKSNSESHVYAFVFDGKGSAYFGLLIKNFFYTLFTLGLYYPWARADTLQFFYSHTSLAGERFKFTADGRQMFKGFIKAMLIIIVLYGSMFLAGFYFANDHGTLLIIQSLFFFILAALIPFAIHGSVNFLVKKTQWKGGNFSYTGDLGDFYKMFVRGLFLSLISFGIYGFWFLAEIRNYLVNNIKYGDVEFELESNGMTYLGKGLIAFLLTLPTLGIIWIWYSLTMLKYHSQVFRAWKGDRSLLYKLDIGFGSFAFFWVKQLLLVGITFGIAIPWVIVNYLKMISSKMTIESEYDLLTTIGDDPQRADPTGDDLAQMLDLSI